MWLCITNVTHILQGYITGNDMTDSVQVKQNPGEYRQFMHIRNLPKIIVIKLSYMYKRPQIVSLNESSYKIA